MNGVKWLMKSDGGKKILKIWRPIRSLSWDKARMKYASVGEVKANKSK